MANELNEMEPVIREEGRDINVIAKQLPVEKDISVLLLIAIIYLAGIAAAGYGIYAKLYYLIPVGIIIPAMLFSSLKNKEAYFSQLQQRIQQSASQINNYQEQRVQILQNTVKLVEKAVDLDKDVFTEIARLRSGKTADDATRNEVQTTLDKAYKNINVAFENYPDLKSHGEIRDAMQQNMYLQREITAAREVYNDVVGMWNREIFEWPLKKYVAAKKGYTTRIPFIASQETVEKSRSVFF